MKKQPGILSQYFNIHFVVYLLNKTKAIAKTETNKLQSNQLHNYAN